MTYALSVGLHTKMRIKNKYLRNRAFRNKHWKRIRNKSHPFETYFPYSSYSPNKWDAEEQVKDHFERITIEARNLENGDDIYYYNTAPKWFRQQINNRRKAKVRNIMFKIRNGDYELEIPKFKNDAAWLYF